MTSNQYGDMVSSIEANGGRYAINLANIRTPLFQKIQDRYHSQEQKEIEEQKKRLAEIRELKQPVTNKNIEEHAKKTREIQKILEQKRRKAREEEIEKHQSRVKEIYGTDLLKSKFTDSFMMHDLQVVSEIKRKETEKFES